MGHDEELTREEREAFRSLGDGRVRSGEEERILRALHDRGLVSGPARRRFGGALRIAAAAAALAVAFLAGAEYGGRRGESPPPPAASGGDAEDAGFAVAGLGPRPTFDEYRDEPDRPVRGTSLDPKGMPR